MFFFLFSGLRNYFGNGVVNSSLNVDAVKGKEKDVMCLNGRLV